MINEKRKSQFNYNHHMPKIEGASEMSEFKDQATNCKFQRASSYDIGGTVRDKEKSI